VRGLRGGAARVMKTARLAALGGWLLLAATPMPALADLVRLDFEDLAAGVPTGEPIEATGTPVAAAEGAQDRRAGEAPALAEFGAERQSESVPEAEPDFVGPPRELAGEGLRLLGQSIGVGERLRLDWTISETFAGETLRTAVHVVRGLRLGPTLCLTAAVHGDELNGVEVVRRLLVRLDERRLRGTVIAVPVVNVFGFTAGSRYLPDRRDLNRFFPGSPQGSLASRIAHSLFQEIVVHCDALIDMHTGSFDRSNLLQVRGDLDIPAVLELTRGFSGVVVLHTPGERGMLRRAATDAGIAAVTFEIGSPLRLEPAEIDKGVQAIEALMQRLRMLPRRRGLRQEPPPVYYASRWVRSPAGGMLMADVGLGERVRRGQRLGVVVDPLRDRSVPIEAPVSGRIIGIAQNQLVLPGFAAFHIGIGGSEEALLEAVGAGIQEATPEHDRLDPALGDPREPEAVPEDEEALDEPGGG
jgi:predicted deacylase